ncbi:hypothetical protein BGX34_007114 [Mortierella sp. NVP85]|nr:hypothetical protein BGX34_007114 [Mortierella sp. NVP85]
MDLQYQYPPSHPSCYSQQRQHCPPQQQQHPYDHLHDDLDGFPNSNSTFRFNNNIHSNAGAGSKQTNSVAYDSTASYHKPNSAGSSNSHHDLETVNENQPVKTHKGKIFQCTGFGDCRMVFTRSEHLARHARKHTGEKPFQCVVDGCMRMFSRFDNMVQHTQTHTKGARPEAVEEIANRIALESRRKSEAGLLGGSTVRRASSIKSLKRGSISSASGSESPQKASRHTRMHSVPMLNMTATTLAEKRSSTPVLPSPVTPSSALSLSPKKHTRQRSKTIGGKETTGKIRKRQGSIRGRRGSLESSIPPTTTESWYASKLHHRPSLDYGLDQHAFFAGLENGHDVNRMESSQLPAMSYRSTNLDGPFGHRRHASTSSSSSSFTRPRHPLSPEHSLPSDDMDSDDGSVHGYHSRQTSGDDVSSSPLLDSRYPADPLLDNCTLPPLRHSMYNLETKPRLPSISLTRLRSQSIASGATASYHDDDACYFASSNNKTRRLSLVDLNAPIQEANVAAHHSALPHTGHTPGGVDVSEDEIKALEAFGQLWSQGRDVEMNDRRSITPRVKSEFAPYEAPVPGPDIGRRPLVPTAMMTFGDDVEDYHPVFHHSPTAMHVD